MLPTILLAVAQVTAPPPAAPPEEIVVVGHRATDALAACLARKCPPAEDVEASLQASVEQFSAGRYAKARHVLLRSIARNRRHAADLPGPVSSLYATLATVAEHDGYPREWMYASRGNVQVLRKYLGPSNPATLQEEMTLARDLLENGNISSATGTLTKVQRLALDSGKTDLAAGATFRLAWLEMGLGNQKRAMRLMDDAIAIAGPANRTMNDLHAIFLARIALRKGDGGAIDALAARLRQSAVARPTLLSSRPVEDVQAPAGMMSNGAATGDIRLADVGYWIRPDGRTSDAEILTTSGLGQWERAVLQQVRERRYIPLEVPAGHPGIYRIDRFTIRSAFDFVTGSRIAQRAGRATTHIVDLTETEAMTAAQKRRVAEATGTSS
ncbi:hypothetical protein [uncultured Sphingomonas sp.]|uniref:hypothetical protein n=1 Tax=uncultured Sphingomonas sp. TaxID=158754 RepID=UPI0025EB120D|nr:hypothetical protein [uncultured Sphingomonas sp.]